VTLLLITLTSLTYFVFPLPMCIFRVCELTLSKSGTPSKQQYDQFQPPPQYKQEKPPRNGHPQQQETNFEASRQQPARTTNTGSVLPQEVTNALKMIEKYKSGEIRNELQVKEGGDLLLEPIVLTAEIYESQTGWAGTWKLEQLEKIHAELPIRDQKSGKEIKKSIRDFRRHVESTSQPEDEIWYAKDIPLMHLHSCINSKKHRNCMGCTSFWKCVQGIQEG
jgi:hypothetical protein